MGIDTLGWVLGGCQVGAVLQPLVGNRRAWEQGAFVGQGPHPALVVISQIWAFLTVSAIPVAFLGPE